MLDVPVLPLTKAALRRAQEAAVTLPQPAVPEVQDMPRQEPGARPAGREPALVARRPAGREAASVARGPAER